jgi:uncharacterized membrane protein
MSLLFAMIWIMAFTPVGYIKAGAVEITVIHIPVIIGAIMGGPVAGLVLGTAFGFSSFVQAFGLSPFGVALMSINPLYTFILMVIPRALMGWLVGLIFKALNKVDKTKIVSFAVTSLSAALLNTVLFMSTLVLLFYNTGYIQEFVAASGASNVFAFVVVFVGINGLIEAVVCTVLGTAISKPLYVLKSRLEGRQKTAENK